MSIESQRFSTSSMVNENDRSCTDWPCLFIFIPLLIVYIFMAVFILNQGSIDRILYPINSQGHTCGVNALENKKYLQFFDIVKCIKYIFIGLRCPTLQICVEQCPTHFYHYKILYAQELQLAKPNKKNLEIIRSKLLCDDSSQIEVNDPQISIYALVKTLKVCAPYSFPSTPFYGRCIPSVFVRALNATIQQADDIIKRRAQPISDDEVVPDKNLIQTSLKYFEKALQLKRILSFMIEDLIKSRFILILSLIVAIVLLIIYMVLLRYIARLIIWCSIVLCVVSLIVAAVFCFLARARVETMTKSDDSINDIPEINVTFNLDYTLADSKIYDTENGTVLLNTNGFDTANILLNQFAPMSIIWLILGVACSVLSIILMICTCCLYDRLTLATELIEESSRAICHTLIILSWPIVTCILSVVVVVFGITLAAFYITLGRSIYQISCSQNLGQSCRTESTDQYLSSNDTKRINHHEKPITCFDFHEGDYCSPDEFAQLNCTTDRIRCVYAYYGYLDANLQDYIDSEWSQDLAKFLANRSWLINLFNLFIIYWLLSFIGTLEEMSLACSFAYYYWNLYKLNRACCSIFTHQHLCLQGLAITVRYHLGTVAFGSSILAIIDTLRTVVDIIKDRLESVNLNNYGRCLFHLIDTCLRCVRSCFHFFSRYTYIMTAVSGKWFCPSAFAATRLLLNNCLRIFVLDRICHILLNIGRLMITIATCIFTGYLLKYFRTSEHLHFSWFPILVSGLTIYISSAIFLNIYSTAASTLFFCVIYDVEVSQNSDNERTNVPSRLKTILAQSKDFDKNQITAKNRSIVINQTQSQA